MTEAFICFISVKELYSFCSMILKDLETADKVLKKEPEETPPSSVDASPLQINIPPSTGRSNTAGGPSPYASPLAGGLLQSGGLTHSLHLNGDLGTLPPGLDFAAAIAAAASSQSSALSVGAGSSAIPMNHDGHVIKPVSGMDPSSFTEWHSPLLSGYISSPSPTMAAGSRGSIGGCGGGEDESTRKRQVRLLKNREAAKECRRKKKEYVKCLESRVAVLENQNKALIEELKTLKELYCRKEKTDM
ncbi:bZIP transcription factor [Dictyocaulus viviparus]|uniref:BZIP transcription factor n=1 Tax=Dictyocaulus viviparus TaxID=29172 RepID=A0A0D8Y728_DICVI|nr:bZIP transcription factor [Dictyocaulus viviparus]